MTNSVLRLLYKKSFQNNTTPSRVGKNEIFEFYSRPSVRYYTLGDIRWHARVRRDRISSESISWPIKVSIIVFAFLERVLLGLTRATTGPRRHVKSRRIAAPASTSGIVRIV